MTILDKIVNAKRQEVEQAKRTRPPGDLAETVAHCPPTRDFATAVMDSTATDVRLIAEIKKASPSAGLIVPSFDPVTIARVYYQTGAAALSVLTDERFFQGRLVFIAQVKEAVPLPVLRKDFIIDEYQVYESRAAGADCILLIAEILDAERIEAFANVARTLGMAVLVEVHTEANLDAVLARLGLPNAGGYLLGINNRDLSVQRTDLAVCERLGAKLPAGCGFVAESGIATREDVKRIRRAGARAMLVGESLLRAADTKTKVFELLGRSG